MVNVEEFDERLKSIRDNLENNQRTTNRTLRLLASKIGASHTVTTEELEEIRKTIATKQDRLESGSNIKTVNNNTLLGSGNVDTTPDSLTEEETILIFNEA